MSLRGRFCEAPKPGATHPRCVLNFPHPGQEHTNGHESWSGSLHGDPGHIIDVAFDFSGETLVDRVAIAMMVAFGRVEPDNSISKYPVSTVASFADMARAVVTQFNVADQIAPIATPTPDGCAHCGKSRRGHAVEHHDVVGFHSWEEPTDSQRKDRMLARRRANEERAAQRG